MSKVKSVKSFFDIETLIKEADKQYKRDEIKESKHPKLMDVIGDDITFTYITDNPIEEKPVEESVNVEEVKEENLTISPDSIIELLNKYF